MLRKPARWALTPGLVNPKWQWVHRRLLFGYPGWGLSKTSDVLTGEGQTPAFTPLGIKFGEAHNDTAGSIDIEVGFYGTRYVFDNSGGANPDENHVKFIDTEGIITPSSLSIFCFGSTANTTAAGHFMIAKNFGTAYDYGIYTTSSGLHLFYGATTRALSLSTAGTNKSRFAVWISASAGGVEAGKYEDGVFTFSSVAGVTLVNNSGQINIGGRSGDTHGWDGAFDTAFVVKGKTTRQNFIDYVADPFGPFRMVDEVGTVVGLPIDGDITRDVSPVSAAFTAVPPFVTIKRILVPVTAVFTATQPIITIKRLVSPTVSTFIAKTPKITIKRLVTSVTATFTSVTPTTIRSISVDSTIATFTAVTPIISITRLVKPVIATFIAIRPDRIGGVPPAPSGKRYPPLLKYPGRGMDR